MSNKAMDTARAALATLLRYLPATLLHRLATHPVAACEVESVRRLAIVAVVDIAGFTKLTEQFETRGAASAEALNELLNAYFAGIVRIISEAGGDVVEFSSDAAVAVWDVDEPRELRIACVEAARCVVNIQSFFASHPCGNDAHLRVHAGLAAGDTFRAILGGFGGRWHLLLAGPAVREAALAMARAAPGTVLLAKSAHDVLGANDCIFERSSDTYILQRVVAPRTARDAPQRPAFVTPIEAARGFAPRPVQARVDAGHIGWLAEFRRMTVMFVNIGLPGFGAPEALSASQAATLAIQRTVARYEGDDFQIVDDEKGSTLVATWGGPLHAHEDDATRAVLAGLAIARELDGEGVNWAIGIATGPVFCGSRNAPERSAYVMNGNGMNLAARLARHPAGGLLCDAETATAVPSVEFERLGDFSIKGRSGELALFRPAGRFASPAKRPQSAIVGRTAERAQLEAGLAALQAHGLGGTLIVAGEPGIGKSRLLAHVVQVARSVQLRCASSAAEAIEQSTSYFAWRAMLAQILESQGVDKNALRERLLQALESDTTLTALASLLNPLLDIDLDETLAVTQLEAAGRADAVRDLVVHLVEFTARNGPLLLVLDDVHWLDSASWTIVAGIARRLPQVLIVLGTRPLVEPLPAGYAQLRRVERVIDITLSALAPAHALALASERLGVATLPPAVAALVQAKAEGNPFFTEQLVYSMRDAGDLVVEEGVCRYARTADDIRSVHVPDTVQGVVVGRIDRLSQHHQLALKIASVVGRAFTLSLMRDIYPIREATTPLGECLNDLSRLELLVRQDDEHEPAYAFKHAIAQEVAYAMLSFANRRDLHRVVAKWYEAARPAELEANLPLLAYHWTRAGDRMLALGYLERAAEQAERNHANSEVVRFMLEALQLDGDGASHADRHRRSRHEFRLAEALLKLSRYNDSLGHFLSSLRLVNRPVPTSRTALRVDLVKELLVQVGHRAWMWRATSRGDSERAELLQAAHAHQRIAEIGYWNHDFVTLLHSTLRSLNIAEHGGPTRELQLAYHVMGFTCGLMTLHRAFSAYRSRSQRLAERISHLETLAFCAQLDNIYYNCNARWNEVYATGTRSAELFQRLGDRFRWQTCVILQAYGALHQGDLARARDLFDQSLRMVGDEGTLQGQVWGVAGLLATDLRQHALLRPERKARLELLMAQRVDHSDAIMCRGLLAAACLHDGERDAAIRHAAVATQLIDKFPPASFHTLIANASIVELHLRLWREEAAQAETHARNAGHALRGLRRFAFACPIGAPSALRLHGRFELQSGRPARAVSAWRHSVRRANELGMSHDEGLARLELARHLGIDDAAALQHAIAGLERSGDATADVERAIVTPRVESSPPRDD